MNPFKKVLNQQRKIKYNIDFFLPSKIIGWVLSEKIIFDEICLISDKVIISKCSINIQRNDVFETYGGNHNSGFILELTDNLPYLNNKRINLVARSFKKNKEINLKIFKKKSLNFNSQSIKNLLSSDLIGLDGHFDGKSDDGEFLHGWISTKHRKAPTLWLNIQNNSPIPIKCDEEHFKEIDNKKFFNYSFYIDEIPISYKGEAWLTFDREGLFRIPQADPVKIEVLDIDSRIINLEKINTCHEDDFLDMLENSSEENKKYWEEIISCDLFFKDMKKTITKGSILSFSDRLIIVRNLLIKPFSHFKIIKKDSFILNRFQITNKS
tara:strand:+ start:24 stop:995 length:972 start_codon:yes stop_codon:yes gene_type:complete